MVQILNGATIIDECGPWENEASAYEWANAYTNFKQGGGQEPVLLISENSTIDSNNVGESGSEV